MPHQPTPPGHRDAALRGHLENRAARRNQPLIVLLSLCTLFLAACDVGGGGSGGGASAAASGPPATTVGTPSAVNSIELPPGQAQATLGWAPSEGEVAVYLVYESRNGSEFTYSTAVTEERATISGSDGDRVQIVVVAMNETDQFSNASPPSPQLVFNEAAEAVTAVSDAAAVASSTPLTTATTTATSGSSSSAQAVSALEETATAERPERTERETTGDEATEEFEVLGVSMTELLVQGDSRFPAAGLSDDADAWLQSKFDEQFSAGVRLVGTGSRDADEYRELVWQDSAGQILVSDGRAVMDLTTSAEMPATFEAAIRLGVTERFVALADFDGDSIGDWLIEDTATGDVLLLEGVSLETTDARTSETLDAVLVGHGDFDDNGREEIVWLQADGRIQTGSPTAPGATLIEDFVMDAESTVLAVADLNGDGRDDLLVVDGQGRMDRAMNGLSESAIRFDLETGPSETVSDREFIFAVDADDDGRADVAWWQNDELDLWDAQMGPGDF